MKFSPALFACFALLGLVAAVSVPASLLDDPMHGEFVDFLQTYGKTYDNAEYLRRFEIFKENVAFVNSHDAEAAGFTVALNVYGDMTNDEFTSRFNGYQSTHEHAAMSDDLLLSEEQLVSLPSTVDWRQKGAVTPVKNQGQCGSCWAFSTTGSVEGAHFLKTGKLVSLSEQNLVDCSGPEGNNGCGGGLMDNAFEYIIKNHGIDTEASYPYTASDGTCHFKEADVGATISSYHDIPRGSESALQAAAAQQPVSVAIDASHMSFQFYSGGVYKVSDCSTTALDHGVLVVGYGTDSGKDYWLVKNSWGPDWGLSGYIMMARNYNNMCGIATESSYPIV